MPQLTPRALACLLAFAGLCGVVRAEDGERKMSVESELEASYIGRSDARGGDQEGSFEAFELRTRDVLSYQIRQGFLVRLGFELQRDTFSSQDRSDVPSALEKVNLVIGADFQLGEAWLFRMEVAPGFYSNDW